MTSDRGEVCVVCYSQTYGSAIFLLKLSTVDLTLVRYSSCRESSSRTAFSTDGPCGPYGLFAGIGCDKGGRNNMGQHVHGGFLEQETLSALSYKCVNC